MYKDRWQIELFFKALKQNLRVKTFVGTTENALYIHIWTALIAGADRVYAVESRHRMVVIEFGGFPALESVYIPQLVGVAGPAGRYPTP